MTVATSVPNLQTQRLVLPSRHSWEDFKAIQTVMRKRSGLRITYLDGVIRITYLDGVIEFITLGEYHESVKTIIGFLIEYYLFNKCIEFFR